MILTYKMLGDLLPKPHNIWDLSKVTLILDALWNLGKCWNVYIFSLNGYYWEIALIAQKKALAKNWCKTSIAAKGMSKQKPDLGGMRSFSYKSLGISHIK